MPANNNELEKRLWDAADELRANSKLKSSEYSVPVLGLIFLKFADNKFAAVEKELETQQTSTRRRRRGISKTEYLARCVYLPEEARFRTLLDLPEGENMGRAISDAMKAIEEENPDLRGVLPKTYNRLSNENLVELLRILNSIPADIEGDAFGKIYEYFLGKFAMSEGQKGGEFFTPTSIVKLIVEILEPFSGRIYDPASGSGGMFVQSARFVKEHQKDPNAEISVFGQERVLETVRLGKMNLAVHNLGGDIKQGNTYYEDLHNSVTKKGQPGKFDFVMANPPFNVDRVDKSRLSDDPRYRYGLPTADNANYLWIQIFASALNECGRAGFVMHDSASDARGSEQRIRKELIETGGVDVIVGIATKFFYTVTQSCTLWFLDNGKRASPRGARVLFIDARHIYHTVSRAHREFLPEQIEFISNIVKLYRETAPNTEHGSGELVKKCFPDGRYVDVPGLCKAATLKETDSQGWSLNVARYVQVDEQLVDARDFRRSFGRLHDDIDVLNDQAEELEERLRLNAELFLGS